MTKLKWMNGEYIKAMGDDEFYEWHSRTLRRQSRKIMIIRSLQLWQRRE